MRLAVRAPCTGPAVLAACVLAAPAVASDDWVRVRSRRLEVLSDSGQAAAVQALRRLERLDGVLRRLFPPRSASDRPLTLLVLGNHGRFSRIVPRDHRRPGDVEAFFQGGSERDFAALRFASDRPYPLRPAEHELAHLILNASLPAQPVWVAEGLAELVSGAELGAREARLGAARPEHEALLSKRTPLPVRRLLEIGWDSPEYLGEKSTGFVYAQSWAVARWVLHRHGIAGLLSFLEAVSAGRDPAAAFAERLSDPAEVDAALLSVPSRPLLRVPLDGPSGRPLAVDTPATAEVEQRFGDLLLHGGDLKRARSRLRRALSADPDHVPSRVSLARLLLRKGKREEARRQLERAAEVAPDAPALVLQRVRLQISEALARGVPIPAPAENRLVADLEWVVARAPRLHQAVLLLARLRPEPYSRRIALLQPLFEQQPERMEVAQALSNLHLKSRNLTAARAVLVRAREAARDPAYRYLFDRRLAQIQGFASVTREVEGRLVDLECPSDGSLRFTIVSGSSTITLEAASARSFIVHDANRSLVRELVCGPQSLPLVARYVRRPGRDPSVRGQMVWLSLPEPPRSPPRP